MKKEPCKKHAYTGASNVIRHCLNCRHTQYNVNGKWVDEQVKKVKAPGKHDPVQMTLRFE